MKRLLVFAVVLAGACLAADIDIEVVRFSTCDLPINMATSQPCGDLILVLADARDVDADLLLVKILASTHAENVHRSATVKVERGQQSGTWFFFPSQRFTRAAASVVAVKTIASAKAEGK